VPESALSASENDAPQGETQNSEQNAENKPDSDVLGEKLGRISGENFRGEIEPAQGEIQGEISAPDQRGSGRNYTWSISQETLASYRILKYKSGRYFKARSTYRSGKQHDKHICAVAPIYETQNSHKAKAARAAYARQRKTSAGRTRQR
jgi:hypothetical protein